MSFADEFNSIITKAHELEKENKTLRADNELFRAQMLDRTHRISTLEDQQVLPLRKRIKELEEQLHFYSGELFLMKAKIKQVRGLLFPEIGCSDCDVDI